MGLRGAILTYAHEIVVDNQTEEEDGRGLKGQRTTSETEKHPDVDTRRDGVLTTVERLSVGGILALK